MSLNTNAIPICGLMFDGNKVADITKAGNKFGWRVNRSILQPSQTLPRTQFYSNLKEANIECLKWLKNNTKIDIFQIKSSLMLRKASPLDAYRENYMRRNRLPAVTLTIGGPNTNGKALIMPRRQQQHENDAS